MQRIEGLGLRVLGWDLEMDAEVWDAQEGLLDVDNLAFKATPGLFYNSATG